MARYLVNRLIQAILLLFGVLLLVFFMVRLNGDPAVLMVSRQATPEELEAFREAQGLNRPLMEQFTEFITDVMQGDLGRSLRLNLPNNKLIAQRVPATFELALSSLLLALTIAIPLGILAGMRPGSPIDFVARGIGLVGQTIPNFWLAMILIIIFAVELRLLPSFGRDNLKSLVLPAVALGIGSTGQIVRLTRSAVLEIRNENYIRTAHAKGVTPLFVAYRHIAPNAAIPLVSVIGVNFTYLLGGSVIIETIFAWPGLGSLLNDAINDNDFPLVQAITIFIALFAVTINLVTDLIYGWIDPRIRYG